MRENKSSIVFTGDIGFDRYMEGKWEDETLLSQEILEFIHKADHVLANVEGALIPQNEAEDVHNKGVVFHTMDPRATVFLDKIHADIWDFANNHTLDAGAAGIRNSIKIAHEHGAQTFGAGENVDEAAKAAYIYEAGGIGFIGVGYMPVCVRATETSAGVFGWDEIERIEKAIAEVKSKCRWCVIVCHGGEEFTILPPPYTRELYLKYLEIGADIVVGHHPHVPMNYERIGEKTIFYSLGNFIFDTDYQRAQKNTDIGLLLKIHFTENDYTFEVLGTKLKRGEQKITAGPVADIFVDVRETEYNRLIPMAAKAFLGNEKRRVTFLNPETHKNYSDEQWMEYFLENTRVHGRLYDMDVYVQLADQAENSEFECSSLDGVKAYIKDYFTE